MTRPGRHGWRIAARNLLVLLPVLLLCGWQGDFLRFGLTTDYSGLLTIALVAIFVPALGEEVLFRALLLPRPEEPGQHRLAAILSISAFVAWHPLQAAVFGANAVPVFLDPWFLVAVAALGTALASTYLATRSLWPCVVMHWTVVVGWKAFAGGPPNPFS
ncbi:CPBP family glutamic-type intramembrane protease [Parasphingopyxis algicola]|uniref:CPBP family glutamic-type intramembrane protease n=1 Tax=Parasphingopyxis algicola TaxID=2026624 RepID=UPI001C4090E0|nr:CPBP family glutamic-type intramembrane protease [Parasphingopyxis algicola]